MSRHSNTSLEVVCLGTGVAHSHVYQGTCSSAYAIVLDKQPILLVGLGGGVIKQCLDYFGCVPEAIFIPNNRSHWASELSTLLPIEAEHGRKVTIIAEMLVMFRLQQYRLSELIDAMKETMRKMDHIANWVPLIEANSSLKSGTDKGNSSSSNVGGGGPTSSSGGGTTGETKKDDFNLLGFQSPEAERKQEQEEAKGKKDTFFEIASGVYLSLAGPARSSERSFGFKISVGRTFTDSTVLMSMSCDSPWDADFYTQLSAPVVFLDAQTKPTHEHAGFDQIINYSKNLRQRGTNTMHPNSPLGSVYVIGQYGSKEPPPQPGHEKEGGQPLQHVVEGATVTVFPNKATLDPSLQNKVRQILDSASRSLVPDPQVRMTDQGQLVSSGESSKKSKHVDPAPTVPMGRWGTNKANTSGVSATVASRGRAVVKADDGYSSVGRATTPRRGGALSQGGQGPVLAPAPKGPNRLASIATKAWAQRMADSTEKLAAAHRRPRSKGPVIHHSGTGGNRDPSPARWEPKRVFIYSNEDRTAREKLVMVQALNNVDQLRQLCSDKLGILPVADMVLVRENTVVDRLDQIPNNALLVVTQLGGARYDARALPLQAQKRLEVDDGSPSPRRRHQQEEGTPTTPAVAPIVIGMPSLTPPSVPKNRPKESARTPSKTKSYPKGTPFGPNIF